MTGSGDYGRETPMQVGRVQGIVKTSLGKVATLASDGGCVLRIIEKIHDSTSIDHWVARWTHHGIHIVLKKARDLTDSRGHHRA